MVVPPSGYSMGARYRAVEGLVLQPAPARIRVGAVVALARDEQWVLHRVLGFRGGHLLTKGDALATLDDPPARCDQVEAVLVARVVGGRRVAERRWTAWCLVLRGWLHVGVHRRLN